MKDDKINYPPKVELFKLKTNITGFAYVDDIKEKAANVGFEFGFVEGTQHAASCLLDYIKENNLKKEDFKELIEKMICRKLN